MESAEDIAREIEQLQEKYNKALAVEEEEASEKIEYPIADIMLKVGHGNQFPKKGVTPAEVAVLVAMHHANAGGNPVSNVRPTGTIAADPLVLRRVLVGKYSKEKVFALFPGQVPQFPTKFTRAVKIGLDTELKPERLFDLDIAKS